MTSKKTANRRGTESAAPDGPVRDGGNVLGADPHKRTLTATVLDERGGVLGTSVFNVSGEGHRAMEAWALSFGPVSRWGIEGAAGIGRHTAMFLARRGTTFAPCAPTGPMSGPGAPAGQERRLVTSACRAAIARVRKSMAGPSWPAAP